MDFEKHLTSCHDFGDVLRHGLLVFESVEVDDLIVAQRGIGPLSIRSRVNQPPGVSDGNFRDFILQIVPTRL